VRGALEGVLTRLDGTCWFTVGIETAEDELGLLFVFGQGFLRLRGGVSSRSPFVQQAESCSWR